MKEKNTTIKVIQFISNFLDNKKNCLLLNADFSHRELNKTLFDLTLFGLNTISSIYKPSFFYEYFHSKDTNKYDLIVAELPFGLASVKNKNFDSSIPENWNMIYRLLSKLKNNSILLVGIEPNFGISTKSKIFLRSLQSKGFFLNSLIETPQNILAPLTVLQPNIAIFSTKDNTNKLFIASLNETDNEKNIFENFSNIKSKHNLSEGDIVNSNNFKGFFSYRINKKIENLQTQYKEFKKKYFREIATKINSTRTIFEEKDGEYLYISQRGNLNVYSNLDKLDKKHQNFYQIKINKEIATSMYLEQYFRSDLGQLSLKSLSKLLSTGLLIPRINKNELEELEIPLPPLKVQEEIISSYTLLDNVFNVINSLEKDLSLNPKNAKQIIEKLTDTLKSLNELSKADKILYYLRQGENLEIEYKQTFSTDIKTGKKEKFIEDSSLKNIVGFLNKIGGVLLIGVTDNSQIYGIKKDAYQSDDKYLLHFKNRIKTAIGEEFFDIINYEIVDIFDKKVLFVECKKSSIPVFMYSKDFYVRTNPATDKLEGPKLAEYLKSHFE